ncbi:hypothetical protein ACFYOK_04645 [Microbispora bryophytorum]|uniref:hypothetical protein n=1 Tax=Microbispora bryophytorum TaxID=1460882 RepID=UPI0033FBF806
MHYFDITEPLYTAHENRSIRDWIAKRDDLPSWVVPYELNPADSAFSYGANVLASAAIEADKTDAAYDRGEEIRQAYVDAAVAIGERFRAEGWRAAYIGIPLLAANLATRSIIAGMREADQLWDEQTETLLDSLRRTLWPLVEKAAHPGEVLSIGLALQRRVQQVGVADVRGLMDLIRLGTVDKSRYPVAVMHLLRTIARNDMAISARERRGAVLVEMFEHALD